MSFVPASSLFIILVVDLLVVVVEIVERELELDQVGKNLRGRREKDCVCAIGYVVKAS